MEGGGGKIVDCAFTERAKKKVKQTKSREKRDGASEETPEGLREPLRPPRERGVVYLGHVPHGFYEQEMRSYFSQFGTVTRLKLHRSRKTGRSKGYAFVEFDFPEVAEIASESMNNYLMFHRLLKCHVVEPEKVRKRMLMSDGSDVASCDKTRSQAQREHNRPRSVPEVQKRVSRLLSREKRKRKRFEELGLDYQFPGYRGICEATAAAKTPTHTIFTDDDDVIDDDVIEEEGESEKDATIEETESE